MTDRACLDKMILEQERIAKLETQVETIKEDVKELREDVRDLHSRVTTTTREIVEKMDDMQTRLEHRMAASQELAKQQHKEIQEEIQKDVQQIGDRVDTLEKWRWMIVGGAIVVGYIMGHINILTNFVK